MRVELLSSALTMAICQQRPAAGLIHSVGPLVRSTITGNTTIAKGEGWPRDVTASPMVRQKRVTGFGPAYY